MWVQMLASNSFGSERSKLVDIVVRRDRAFSQDVKAFQVQVLSGARRERESRLARRLTSSVKPFDMTVSLPQELHSTIYDH